MVNFVKKKSMLNNIQIFFFEEGKMNSCINYPIFPCTRNAHRETKNSNTIYNPETPQRTKIETNRKLTVTRQQINPPIMNIKIKTWFPDFHPS